MRRFITTVAMATGAVVALSVPAWAVPGGGAGQYTFPMVCDGQTVTLTIGSGRWAAAYVLETSDRFVPIGTSVSVTDLATGETLFSEQDLKPSVDDKADTTCVDGSEGDGVSVVFEVYGVLK